MREKKTKKLAASNIEVTAGKALFVVPTSNVVKVRKMRLTGLSQCSLLVP